MPEHQPPRIAGAKLDITFRSQRQLEQQTENEMQEGNRPPMIAGGRVPFDKTGSLADLKGAADAAQPRAYDPTAAQLDQFMALPCQRQG